MNAVSSKVDIKFLESPVRFSFRNICKSKDFGLKNKHWDTKTLKVFKDKIEYIEENRIWKDLLALGPKNGGVKVDYEGSSSYKMIDELNTYELKDFEPKYYFHLELKKKDLFRVFGYQNKDMFCVTHLDIKGLIHHK